MESWRQPTAAQLEIVQARYDERAVIQEVIGQRNAYRADPRVYDALDKDARWDFGKRYEEVQLLLRDDPTLSYVPFDRQIEFHSTVDEARVKMLIAGNRGGKTTPAAVEAAWWAMGTHPFIWTPPPPVDIWFVSVDKLFAHRVAQKMLTGFLPKGTKLNQQKMFYTLPNGSTLWLMSQEAGREKFQGDSIPLVIWDEEGESEDESEKIYGEIRTRLVDQEGMIVMALTMLNFYQWIEDLAAQAEDEEVADAEKRVRLFTWSMRDNPHIPQEEVDEFEESLSEEDALVRIYGNRLRLGMKSIFPKSSLMRMVERARQEKYVFATLEGLNEAHPGKKPRMVPSAEATELRVFEWPQDGVEYIIAADPSGGDGGNPASAIVYRRDTKYECAVLRSAELAPKEFARELYKLGYAYWMNKLARPALLAPEQNNHGHAVINELDNLDYPNMWHSTTPGGTVVKEPGFRTNVQTKPAFEGFIMSAIKNDEITIKDHRAVEEMSTYTKNPRTGATGAQKGRTDDLVICWGIALFVDDTEPGLDMDDGPAPQRKAPRIERGSESPAGAFNFAMDRNWREVEETRR